MAGSIALNSNNVMEELAEFNDYLESHVPYYQEPHP